MCLNFCHLEFIDTHAQQGIVHFMASVGIIGCVFSPGIRQLDSLLHDRVRHHLKLTLAFTPGMPKRRSRLLFDREIQNLKFGLAWDKNITIILYLYYSDIFVPIFQT